MLIKIQYRLRVRANVPRLVGLLLLVSCSSGDSFADVTAFRSVLVDNTSGGAPLAGFVVNDIKIDFTGQFTGAAAQLGPLAAGSIYQDGFGTSAPPLAALLAAFPSAAFDTFVALGSPTANGPWGDPVVGDCGFLGCSPAPVFNSEQINIAWHPAGGGLIADQTNFLIMRLTLRNNANGTAQFLASAAGTPVATQASIENGVVSFVPEPTSLGMIAIACIGSLAFHRRRRLMTIRRQLRDGSAAPRWFGLLLLMSCWASDSFAGVTTIQSEIVNNVAGGAPLAGYVTNDVKITFFGQYTGAQALINLTSGTLYQDATGSATAPSPVFVGVFPSLTFDTFVAQGSPTSGGVNGDPSLGGGAVDLGGAASASFTASGINQAWNPAGGVTITDQSNFLIGRFTLSRTANGTAKFLASAGGMPVVIHLDVSNGIIGYAELPEPTGLVLIALMSIAIAPFVRHGRSASRGARPTIPLSNF